jgi:hypothetical protein
MWRGGAGADAPLLSLGSTWGGRCRPSRPLLLRPATATATATPPLPPLPQVDKAWALLQRMEEEKVADVRWGAGQPAGSWAAGQDARGLS